MVMQGKNCEKIAKVNSVIQSCKRLYCSYREPLLLAWDIFMFAVVGLNSFILLIHRNREHQELMYAICAGAAIYFVVLVFQTSFLFHHKRRHETLIVTKKIFRLFYTALYLTAIMLDVLALVQTPGAGMDLAYHGILFIWVSLWGTNFLWIKQVCRLVGRLFHGARRLFSL